MLSNHASMHLSLEVINGRKDGPTLFLSGAVHGDEIIGVEIIRRIARSTLVARMAGTLILAPVVNAYGFVSLSRYLPDRRDLNRSFPGSRKGSLAAQLADHFMREIVARSTFGIDLHSGAVHRENLPQIRASLEDPKIRDLAAAFGAPIVLDANLRDGSLRQAAQEAGCAMLLYEAGEALRFDERAIRTGVRGVINVMRHVGMLPPASKPPIKPVFSGSSVWTRAPIGGVLRTDVKLGGLVRAGQKLGVVADPLGQAEEAVEAKNAGVLVGRTNLPIVNRGDALFHIAEVMDALKAGKRVQAIERAVHEDPLFDSAVI